MSQLVLGGTAALLAGVTWFLTRSRGARAIAHWSRAWLFLFAICVVFVLTDGAALGECVMHLLAPFFPALILAGALSLARRRVPAALFPAAFALGAARASLFIAGHDDADHLLGLLFEAGALGTATVLAWRTARGAPRESPAHLLAPSFLVLAGLIAANSITALVGVDLRSVLLAAWAVAIPVAVMVQIAVGRERVLGRQRGVERALSESQERFRALTENSSDLIAEIDRDNRFTYANPPHREWFGVGTDELVGTDAMDMVHPDDREKTRAWYATQLGGGSHELLTIRVPHRLDGWRWVECNSRRFEANGEPHIVVTLRDVTLRIQLEENLQNAHDRLEERVRERTSQLHAAIASLEEEVAERRRVERRLRRSEQRWRDVSNLSSDLSFSMTRSPSGAFTTNWATQAITRISGRTREEIAANAWNGIVHAEDLETVVASMQRIVDGETLEFDARIVTPVGKVRWMRTRITGAGTTDDGSLRILGAAREITEARKAVEERLRLEAHIQEAQKLESLGVLAGGVAHDFNNVLAVILGNDALALADAEPGSRLAKQLERIRSAAKHGQALTSQMLTYSGKVSVSLKPLDVSRLVDDMRELLGAAVSDRCQLDISLMDESAMVQGDPTQLRQVLMNLVTNASEALLDRPGRVSVRVGTVDADPSYLKDTFGTPDLTAGEYVYLEVSDPGSGIDEAFRNRIFEPFFSTKFPGRGLGLASVLGIVRGHGGAIKLTTQTGAGTRFRVLLPPATDAARPVPAPATAKRANPDERRCVLVVDDDEAVREIAGEFLSRGGFDVVTAESGRAALDILNGAKGSEIDVVVLDLSMPGLDGRETLREIRKLRPELPVIVASGFGESVSALSFPSSEIAAFVRKPYEAKEIEDAVRGALAG